MVVPKRDLTICLVHLQWNILCHACLAQYMHATKGRILARASLAGNHEVCPLLLLVSVSPRKCRDNVLLQTKRPAKLACVSRPTWLTGRSDCCLRPDIMSTSRAAWISSMRTEEIMGLVGSTPSRGRLCLLSSFSSCALNRPRSLTGTCRPWRGGYACATFEHMVLGQTGSARLSYTSHQYSDSTLPFMCLHKTQH